MIKKHKYIFIIFYFILIAIILVFLIIINQNLGVTIITEKNYNTYSELYGVDLSKYVENEKYKIKNVINHPLNMGKRGDKIILLRISEKASLMELIKSENEFVYKLPNLVLENSTNLILSKEDNERWSKRGNGDSILFEFDIISKNPLTDAELDGLEFTVWMGDICYKDEMGFVSLGDNHYRQIFYGEAGEKYYYSIMNNTGQELIITNGKILIPEY